MLDIFHNVIFRYLTLSSLIIITSVFLMAVLCKLITLVVIATDLAYQGFQDFYSYLTVSGAYPARLEQLLKYLLGMWGAHREFYCQLYTKSYQQTTSVKISSME